MAYVKNNWVDREGTTRYFETVDDDGALIFTPDYTQVTELGTPVNADNMNHIEEGIAAGSFTKFDLNATYAKDDLVTVIEDASPAIYKSLQDNNIGNALSNSAYWEKISLGGGGGLEIGDIGIAPLGIDESKGKRRYLNGQILIQEQYVQFTNKVKSAVALYPSLACTESEWQTTATMTVGGQVGKFVVDNEAGTIRLPKIIMPIQGLTDLSKLGEIVEAGLPTHTHTRGTMNITGTFGALTAPSGAPQFSGAISKAGGFSQATGVSHNNAGHHGARLYTFDASKNWGGSTSTGNYSKSLATTDTVQQEQIQYPYFIQVATGAETEDNIINEIELNNPFSLLDYKYSEYELNNLSWLRSNGQYNSKAIYPAVYDLLLKIYNGTETKAGVSVKLSTETFTDYDFVLNTAEETFRLPVKVKLASGKAVVGNGVRPQIRLSNGNVFTLHATTANSGGGTANRIVLGLEGIIANNQSDHNFTLGNANGESTGLELSDSDLYLYFYVGETVQNANLINAGRIEEIKANKTDVDGQWVSANYKFLQNSVGTINVDLSSLIPKDGYIYELSINVMLVSTTYCQLQINGGVINQQQVAYSSSLSTGKQDTIFSNVIVPLKRDRVIRVDCPETPKSYTLTVVGYRRVGTNL